MIANELVGRDTDRDRPTDAKRRGEKGVVAHVEVVERAPERGHPVATHAASPYRTKLLKRTIKRMAIAAYKR